MPLRNLVLAGGEFRTMSYLPLIEYLEKEGHLATIQNYYVTSAGIFFAIILSIGCSYKEIHDFMTTIDFSTLMNIDPASFLFLHTKFGVDDGEKIIKLCSKILELRLGSPDITFAEHQRITGKTITATGTNLAKLGLEIFSPAISPTMRIIDAVRITTSIPFYFFPARYNGALYVDGGITNNFPIDLVPPHELNHTIGALVITPMAHSIETASDYMNAIYQCSIMNNDRAKSTKYAYNTVVVNIRRRNPLAIMEKPEILLEIIEEGREALTNWLTTHGEKWRENLEISLEE
ncbi:MAG: hypothetical protein F2563_04175 [Actinobacteria bacterium]|uniref:Unannotated protein n=1 Tax=freshwater metagenome TaxID=449393 RepID=A0A6J6ESL0_9ZZZZ|nr:hypothetical protein [Actinomycetota bacterium]